MWCVLYLHVVVSDAVVLILSNENEACVETVDWM